MSGPQRLAAIAVGALVIVAVAILALGAAGAPIGHGPEASANASFAAPSSASAAASASPLPSTAPTSPEDADVLAALAEIEEQVIAVRGLPAADIGSPELITRQQLGAELRALFAEEYPPEEREEANRALRALGLLAPDEDFIDLQLGLLGDQVLGFYDSDENRMVVVTDVGLDVEAKVTYAHEYAHALQDAAFDPAHFEPDAELEDDRFLALTSLTEGDATVTMLAWGIANLSQEELIEFGAGAQLPDTTGIPSWMVNQLQFPYTAGLTWATALVVDPLRPDFTAIDAAYADPPDSTEQILHLEAWEAREAPVEVEVPDLVQLLGDGWEEVDDTPIGEAGIGIMLEHFGIERVAATAAADGWGGDRVRIAVEGEDRFAVAWRLVWDSGDDAAEFSAAYEAVVPELPFPAIVSRLSSDTVLVVHASDEELLRQVAGAAG